MRGLRSAGGTFLWVFACVLAVSLVTVVSIRVHLYILRHRAELLMADMESITLRQTTFVDVQPLFLRWRHWGEFEGPCSEARCKFDISLSEVDTALNRFLYRHDALFNLAASLGVRPTRIRAELTVINGLVWSEGIAFEIENRGWYPDGKPYVDIMSGDATSWSILDPVGTAEWHWRLHPDYTIWGPSNLPNVISLNFTPFANFAEIHRLMSLNFSCLTRIVPCKTDNEIMPEAFARVAYWSSLPDDTSSQKNPCDDALKIEYSARDSRNIVIATVSTKRVVRDYESEPGGQHFHEQLRMLILQERLKNTGINKAPSRIFLLDSPELWTPGSEVQLRPGSSVFLFYKDDSFDRYSLTGCSPSDVTQPNLAAIRRGIAEDNRPPGLPEHAFQFFGSADQ